MVFQISVKRLQVACNKTVRKTDFATNIVRQLDITMEFYDFLQMRSLKPLPEVLVPSGALKRETGPAIA
jgi:hypothetical protein